ncbi:SHOCT domain-containing protein [Clostridium sp.]|uniref:SHOCT domain-containing protein n=1 Tax=Clostridium sp. TaxID=1506 RepID=UPI003D6D73E8
MKSLYKVWKDTKKAHEDKETCIRKFNEGGKSIANIKCAFNANILINNFGILYNTTIDSEYFFIPIQSIKKVEVKTDEELSNHVIDNKIPLIGDLNFLRKVHFFLKINYIENNIELEKTIESKMAALGATSIVKARAQYNQDNPKSLLQELKYIPESRSFNEGDRAIDIPEQINKLFELVEKGALSLDEFNQKKKELLLKM